VPDRVIHPLKAALSLTAASTIVETALHVGQEAGLLPLTVAVLDTGGHLVALKRQDGAGIMRVEIAMGKALAALGLGIPSRTIRDLFKERAVFQNAVAAASGGRFVPVPGGVLILDEASEVIGAVGISGDASDKDEYCAIAGVKAAGLASLPAEPAAEWRSAPL
jgi:uncharacterized protein GlcG (DUF336 family)